MLEMLVEIFVPTAGTKKGKVGTAYPIASDKLITANHIIENVSNASDIEVRWIYSRKSEWTKATSIEYQSDELDVAVIHVKFPSGMNEWPILRVRPLAKNEPWYSEGFPKFTGRNQQTAVEAFNGTVINDENLDGNVVLGVDYCPIDASSWSGASGSPIILYGQLCGVVTRAQRGVSGARLVAVPISKLVCEPEFRDAITYEERENWFAQVKSSVEDVFRNSVQLTESFFASTAGNKPSTPISKKIASNLYWIFEATVESYLKLVDELHFNFKENSTNNDTNFQLQRITNYVIPSIFELRGVVDSSIFIDSTTALITFPIATPTVAELVMASREGRKLMFSAYTSPSDYPIGQNCLSEELLDVPESGTDSTDDLEACIDAIKYRTSLIDSTDIESELSSKTYISLLKNEFAARRNSKQTCYFAIRIKKDVKRKSQLIVELKSVFPDLTFIRLTGDEQTLVDERSQMRPIRNLYRQWTPEK